MILFKFSSKRAAEIAALNGFARMRQEMIDGPLLRTINSLSSSSATRKTNNVDTSGNSYFRLFERDWNEIANKLTTALQGWKEAEAVYFYIAEHGNYASFHKNSFHLSFCNRNVLMLLLAGILQPLENFVSHMNCRVQDWTLVTHAQIHQGVILSAGADTCVRTDGKALKNAIASNAVRRSIRTSHPFFGIANCLFYGPAMVARTAIVHVVGYIQEYHILQPYSEPLSGDLTNSLLNGNSGLYVEQAKRETQRHISATNQYLRSTSEQVNLRVEVVLCYLGNPNQPININARQQAIDEFLMILITNKAIVVTKEWSSVTALNRQKMDDMRRDVYDITSRDQLLMNISAECVRRYCSNVFSELSLK